MPRLAVVAALVRPTARVSNLGAAVATVVLAGAPALFAVARGRPDVGAAVVLLVLGTGASWAWAVDDPAAEVLAGTPVSAPFRAALRVASVAAVAFVALLVVAGVVAVAGPGLPAGMRDRLPEGLAAAAAALAAGFVATGRGERAAGVVGVLVGLLVPAVVAGSAMRWPEHLPTFEAGAVHARWWVLALVGLAITAFVARDPAER